jgi:hypothetical protein
LAPIRGSAIGCQPQVRRVGEPGLAPAYGGDAPYALDPNNAERLRQISEETGRSRFDDQA